MADTKRIHASSKTRILIGLSAVLVVLAYVALKSASSSVPEIIRGIQWSNDGLETLWVRDATYVFQSPNCQTNSIYVFTMNRHLMALDGSTGSILWDRGLPVDQVGIRGLLTADGSLFTTSATEAHAYQGSTGEWKWSTSLGDGHVAIYSQIQGSVLRVYYGDRILELSPETGAVLRDGPGGDTLWIAQNAEIHASAAGQGSQMFGVDHTTGARLWSSVEPIFLRTEAFPIQELGAVLLVRTPGLGICALGIHTGRYVWCRRERYLSNLALNSDGTFGYALESNFTLVKIDLASGEKTATTKFTPQVLPEDIRRRELPYTVALTRDLVIVSFGDSNQTFGLRIIR